MNTASIKKAFFAGMAGTVVMTVFFFVAQYLSLPKFDFPGMMANQMHFGGMVGWITYFAFGIFLAYMYGDFFKKMLPGHSWKRGMIYAFILWGGMGMIVMPVLGMGFFAGSMSTGFSILFGMMMYGTTVGYLYEH